MSYYGMCTEKRARDRESRKSKQNIKKKIDKNNRPQLHQAIESRQHVII